MKCTIDYETRSRIDLRKVGTYRYATDPSTRVLCLSWRYKGDPTKYLWHPAMPNARVKAKSWVNAEGKRIKGLPPHLAAYEHGLPEEGRADLDMLLFLVSTGDVTEIEAHNAMFERMITQHVLPKDLPGVSIPDTLWRCSAAVAASFSLPRGLDGAIKALGLGEDKNPRGKSLINRLCKPNSKDEFHEDIESLLEFFDYCRQDVVAEEGLSENLRPLPPIELATWRLDQTMNLRGVMFDRPFVERALQIVEIEQANADLEVNLITGGAVDSTGQRDELLAWAQREGYPGDNLQGDDIDEKLLPGAWDLSPDVRRVMTLRRSLGRTSNKKYQAILTGLCADNRARDLLSYYGANTGRWAGRRIQPHNFPRGNIRTLLGFEGKALDAAWDEWRDRNGDPTSFLISEIMRISDVEDLRFLYGDPMELLANVLRGTIIAPNGRVLNVADYAAIEARVLAWLAGQAWKLDVFRSGKDIYRIAAGKIFGLNPDDIGKDSEQRQIGKATELGLGFQMGAKRFVGNVLETTGLTITESFAQTTVKTWRADNPEVVDLWKDFNACAIEAIMRGPGAAPVPCGKVSWAQRGRFLHVRLPSGRHLSYCDPRIEQKLVEGTRADGTEYSFLAPSIRFMGVDGKTTQWVSSYTYGGSLVENVVQATARDLMRDAMHRLEASGIYENVLTVHDELVAESDADKGSVQEFAKLVSAIEPWAEGMPVKAEAWRGTRYRK